MASAADSPDDAMEAEQEAAADAVMMQVSSEDIEALKATLAAEATAKVEAAVGDLWTRGLKVVQNNQKKHADRATAMQAEIAAFRAHQDHLEAETKKLRSVVDSLARCLALAGGGPMQQAEMEPPTFTFTLRRADNTPLGIHFSKKPVQHFKGGKGLLVEWIQPGSAMDAWNRQCPPGEGAWSRSVTAGDTVLAINGVSDDPAAMLEECKKKLLLRMTVMRCGGAWGTVAEDVSNTKTPGLGGSMKTPAAPGGA